MEANREFFVSAVLRNERRAFAVKVLTFAFGYLGISLWLNSIRATAVLWFVWTLIVVQFSLYFSIFISSYLRSIIMGTPRVVAIPLFVALAVAGRVNNWELVVIPATVLVTLAYSAVNRNLSERGVLSLPKGGE